LSFSEEWLEEQVIYNVITGLVDGYPLCCVVWFSGRVYQGLSHDKPVVFDSDKFVYLDPIRLSYRECPNHKLIRAPYPISQVSRRA
jgi:hypothetical protein